MTHLIQVPVAPDKRSVIPIHASDRGTFKKCRRRWQWSSPMRENLTVKAADGVVMPLWFGSGIHWALKHYYDPTLRRDPVETWQSYFDITWHGGIIKEDWLEISYDRKPKPIQVGTAAGHDGMLGMPHETAYTVNGLQYILPQPEVVEEDFMEHRQLGIKMMEFYKEYAAEFDRFEVIAAEHTFSVPVRDPQGNVMIRRDHRDGEEKEVHLRGTQDAIIMDTETEQYGILEHKSAISIDEQYHEKLDKDEQCTTYMSAAETEAEVYDLPYKRIDFVLYNAVRKAYARYPTITSRGIPSIDRKQETTTPELLRQAISDLGLEGLWPDKPAEKAYMEYVDTVGYDQFIIRTLVHRNRQEIQSSNLRVWMEADDMLSDPHIYPNPTGEWYCLRCPFRAPCIAVDDGSDWKWMIEEGFERNWTR